VDKAKRWPQPISKALIGPDWDVFFLIWLANSNHASALEAFVPTTYGTN